MFRLLVAVLALAAALPAGAQEWWEAETDHFIVKSRSSQAETRKFAEELERYDGALRTLQNIAPQDQVGRANKVTIFRFGDQRDIAHIAGYPGSGIAGFYIPRAGNSVAFVPAREDRSAGSIVRRDERTALDGMSVLKHEYAHHFMMQYFPGAYPRWYVEGYAETVATIRFLDNGSFHVGDPPQYRSMQVMRLPAFRLREMLDANHELSGFDAMQHYGTGWLLSHYLNFDEEGRTKLAALLRALASGEDSLSASERILGDLNVLDRKLSAYRRGRFPGFNVMPANYTAPEVAVRPMAADEVAFIQQKMRLWRGVDKDEARTIQRDLTSRLASHAQSVEGHLLLAEASFDMEDYPAAERAAARALELDPASIRSLIYLGLATLEQAKADSPESGTYAAASRRHLARAIQLDPSDPRPKIAYYKTFAELGAEPTEEALIVLEDAFAYAGSDSSYRYILARQLLAEGRIADARTVVMPAAFSGHSTGEADAAEDDPTPGKLITALNNNDAESAIGLIDGILKPKDEDGKS